MVVIGTLKKVRGGGLSLLDKDSIMHDCWEIFKVVWLRMQWKHKVVYVWVIEFFKVVCAYFYRTSH